MSKHESGKLLHELCAAGDTKKVVKLLESVPFIDVDYRGGACFAAAIALGDVKMLRALISYHEAMLAFDVVNGWYKSGESTLEEILDEALQKLNDAGIISGIGELPRPIRDILLSYISVEADPTGYPAIELWPAGVAAGEEEMVDLSLSSSPSVEGTQFLRRN